MRAFILALALTFTVGLTACADDATEEAYEEGAPVGDQEDVIGDGEVFDEEGEAEGNVLDSDADGDVVDDLDAEVDTLGSDLGDDAL